MNAVAKEVSQTPITDAAAGCTPSFDDGDRCVHVDVARKLETDLTAETLRADNNYAMYTAQQREKAELIAALADLENWATARGFAPSMNIKPVLTARATLARIGAA